MLGASIGPLGALQLGQIFVAVETPISADVTEVYLDASAGVDVGLGASAGRDVSVDGSAGLDVFSSASVGEIA